MSGFNLCPVYHSGRVQSSVRVSDKFVIYLVGALVILYMRSAVVVQSLQCSE